MPELRIAQGGRIVSTVQLLECSIEIALKVTVNPRRLTHTVNVLPCSITGAIIHPFMIRETDNDRGCVIYATAICSLAKVFCVAVCLCELLERMKET